MLLVAGCCWIEPLRPWPFQARRARAAGLWMRGVQIKCPSTEISAVNIEMKLSDDEDAHIVKNLWPLYQHDVSEFETSLVPNRLVSSASMTASRRWPGMPTGKTPGGENRSRF